MTFIFDRETALVAQGDGQFTIEASDVYRNPTGMAFGGWVAAIAARAVEIHPECRGPLVSQQIIYMTGVGPGEVKLSVKLLRAGSSTQFWRVELSQKPTVDRSTGLACSRSSTRRCHGHFSSPNNSAPARPYPWRLIYMRARKIWRRLVAIT